MTDGHTGMKQSKNEAVTQPSRPRREPPKLKAANFILPGVAIVVYVAMLAKTWIDIKDLDNPFQSCGWEVPLTMTVLYLVMCLVGPKLMESRAPFELNEVRVLYNFFQSGLNLWIVLAFIYYVAVNEPSVWFFGLDTSKRTNILAFHIWMHYNNKYIEFLDSVFMILRKKSAQLSFLHIYHHCMMPWAWWMVCHFACGGDAYFGALMNSFIHVLMYYYYGMATLAIPVWWKKYLTLMQMIQFCICATHSALVCYMGDEVYPSWLTYVELWVMFSLLYLFSQFYSKAYSSKKPADKKDE